MEKALSKEKKSSFFLQRQDIAFFALSTLGFFIGRVSIFQILSPLSVPYLSNFLGTGILLYLASALTFLGILTKFKGIYLLKYVICILSLCLINFILNKKTKKMPSIVIRGCLSSGITLSAGLIIAAANNFSLYFALMAILESVLTFCVTCLLKKATDVMTSKRRKKILATEELISISILFGGVIAGASDIYIGVVSLKLFFAAAVILIVGNKGGSALGATVSMLLAFVLYLAQLSDVNFIAILGISGLGSGLLREKGKLASIAGFLLLGTCGIFVLNQTLFSYEMLFSVASGVILFLFMPNNFYFNISSAINPVVESTDEYIVRIKEMTNRRLLNFSDTFKNLSKTFNGLSEKKLMLTQKDISKLIDDLAASVCGNCSMMHFCWQNNFYETYQTVFSLLAACEKKGVVNISDVPPTFARNCVFVQKFVDTTNRLFELYKMNLTWHNRIIESRTLISDQLFSVSDIIKGLADELDFQVDFNPDVEESIVLELAAAKIDIDSVVVFKNKQDKQEVTITRNACYGKKECIRCIIPIVSKVLGVKMRKDDNNCFFKKDKCVFRLIEEQKFRIISGVARATKSGSKETGDSYSFLELKNGECLMALSDGMGSGRKAREESVAVVELLEDFIECGFKKELAVKMINSVLVLKGSDERFSTLDVCSVDLYTGNAEFVKIGAAPSFLLRENSVIQTIRATTLPLGILNDVDVETCTRKIKDNDVIIMVTDGVLEISDTLAEKNTWLFEALSKFKSNNPQDIAEFILGEAEKISKNVIRDDMTVLVARVCKK